MPPLHATDLVPAQPGFLFFIEDFLSAPECAALIKAADAAGLQPSSAADRRPKKGEAYLDRESVAFLEPTLADELWRRLAPLLPVVERAGGRMAGPTGFHGDGRGRDAKSGVGGQLKYYRYQRGHRFGLHVDQSWKGANPGEETEYTFLLYLNSAGEPAAGGDAEGAGQPLQGGDTVFMRTAKVELARVSPRAGAALLHAHGRRCLMHEGAEVTRGVKYLLRADIMYAPASEESAYDRGKGDGKNLVNSPHDAGGGGRLVGLVKAGDRLAAAKELEAALALYTEALAGFEAAGMQRPRLREKVAAARALLGGQLEPAAAAAPRV